LYNERIAELTEQLVGRFINSTKAFAGIKRKDGRTLAFSEIAQREL
jgi:hypothetical protein